MVEKSGKAFVFCFFTPRFVAFFPQKLSNKSFSPLLLPRRRIKSRNIVMFPCGCSAWAAVSWCRSYPPLSQILFVVMSCVPLCFYILRTMYSCSNVWVILRVSVLPQPPRPQHLGVHAVFSPQVHEYEGHPVIL